MAKSDMYKQVKMQRENAIDVVFIPIGLAKVGKRLKVKVGEDEWQDGWIVLEVYAQQSFSDLQIQRRAQKEWMTSHDA